MEINKEEIKNGYDKKFKSDIVEKYIQADLKLAKIQNTLIFIVTILLALVVVLFATRAMYNIKEASASVKTSVNVSIKKNVCNTCLSEYNYQHNLLQKLYCVRICREFINNLK